MFGHNTEVQVADFILTQTGTYQAQHLRPFETTIRQEHVDYLARATQEGKNLGVNTLGDVAGDILHPQAQTEGNVNISNGWTCRRFRFMMRVVEKQPFQVNGTTQRVFFGYTDHSDASYNYLDPNMRIYFNSETVVVTNIRQTPNGPVPESQVVGANQIVSPMDMSGPAGQNNGMFHQPTSFLIRPDDVFHWGETNHVVNSLNQVGNYGDVGLSYDTRAMAGAGGAYKYSRRHDVSPARYLSQTLGAFSKANKEAQATDNVGSPEYLYGEAASYAGNQDIHSNDFFSRLKDHAGYMEKGYVTLRELQGLFPEVEHTMKYSLDDGRSIRKVNQVEDSNHWHGATRTDVAASTLAQVVPAIMMDNFIRSISFAVTNGQGLGNYAIEIHGHGTRSVVDNMNMVRWLELFQQRLIDDVLNTLTYRNQIGFQISMSSDLAGDSVIDISLDGEPYIRYVAPTFSDSLFTPVVTQDAQRPQSISSDLLYLAEQTIETPNVNMVANTMGGYPQTQPAPQAAPYPNTNQPFQGVKHVTDFDHSGLL